MTRTAAQLKTSQPAVSRALAELRRQLGDPLLVRTGSGMALTRRAEDLAEPTREWLATTLTLLEPAQFTPATLERRFRVASTDFGVSAVIAPALAQLMELAPRATVEVVPLKATMIDELASGEVDLLVSGLDPNFRQTHDRYLFTEGFSCLFRADHPLGAERGPVPLEAFLDWPHIAVTIGDEDFDRVESRLGARGEARRIVARLPYFGASPEVIGHSDAIVTIPHRAALGCARAYGLATRPAPIEVGTFDYRLLWHERTARDPAAAWLRDVLAAPHDHPPGARAKSDPDICG